MGAKFCAHFVLERVANIEFGVPTVFNKIWEGWKVRDQFSSPSRPQSIFRPQNGHNVLWPHCAGSAAKFTFSPQPLLGRMESNLGNKPNSRPLKMGRKFCTCFVLQNTVYFGCCAPPLFKRMVRWEIRLIPNSLSRRFSIRKCVPSFLLLVC